MNILTTPRGTIKYRKEGKAVGKWIGIWQQSRNQHDRLTSSDTVGVGCGAQSLRWSRLNILCSYQEVHTGW